MLEIRGAAVSNLEKARRAIAATANARVILPILQSVGGELKRVGWDERGLAARVGLGSALAGGAIFGGQAAGVAALGTAVGVPLWVLFGAGGTFVAVLYQEMTGQQPPVITTFHEVEAERENSPQKRQPRIASDRRRRSKDES